MEAKARYHNGHRYVPGKLYLGEATLSFDGRDSNSVILPFDDMLPRKKPSIILWLIKALLFIIFIVPIFIMLIFSFITGADLFSNYSKIVVRAKTGKKYKFLVRKNMKRRVAEFIDIKIASYKK